MESHLIAEMQRYGRESSEQPVLGSGSVMMGVPRRGVDCCVSGEGCQICFKGRTRRTCD